MRLKFRHKHRCIKNTLKSLWRKALGWVAVEGAGYFYMSDSFNCAMGYVETC